MYIEHRFKQNTLIKYNGINSNVTNELKFMLNFHCTLTKKQVNCAGASILYLSELNI